MKRILVLCNGNTARSQMAEGILRSLSNGELDVYSAGTKPGPEVNPDAVEVMKEIGIDISDQFPKGMDQFLNDSFDYVITVCDDTRESCPYFSGDAKQRLHMGFDSPTSATGTREDVLDEFRRVRDEMSNAFQSFLDEM
jgi:arsenate reductase